MSDPETLAFYAAQTDAYRKMAEGYQNAQLAAYIEALPPGARVLDLGCGPGQDSRTLVQAGFSVLAMDASPEMIRQAAMAEGVETRLGTFADLSDIAAFDAVWASFSLLHAPKADFPGHLSAIHRALKPGGVLALSMKLGQGEGRDRLGRFYAWYSEAELAALLTAAGFRVTHVHHGHSTGMAGTHDPFVTLTAHA